MDFLVPLDAEEFYALTPRSVSITASAFCSQINVNSILLYLPILHFQKTAWLLFCSYSTGRRVGAKYLQHNYSFHFPACYPATSSSRRELKYSQIWYSPIHYTPLWLEVYFSLSFEYRVKKAKFRVTKPASSDTHVSIQVTYSLEQNCVAYYCCNTINPNPNPNPNPTFFWLDMPRVLWLDTRVLWLETRYSIKRNSPVIAPRSSTHVDYTHLLPSKHRSYRSPWHWSEWTQTQQLSRSPATTTDRLHHHLSVLNTAADQLTRLQHDASRPSVAVRATGIELYFIRWSSHDSRLEHTRTLK